MIRYVDLAVQNAPLEGALLDAAQRVIRSGRLVLGEEVEEFEATFAARHGLPWAVGVGSGTDALILTLRALGIGPGDEVITVPNSFVATVAAIDQVGARTVLVDVDEAFTMDPDRLAEAIGPRTRAVLPVHLYGRPAPMAAIGEIASRVGATVIEDCAQAVGAELDGRPVGTFGVAGCYSLHPLKNLAALGDGGMIVGTDPVLGDTLRRLRNHGLLDRDRCGDWGLNSRLDPLQAAMLRVKLEHLDGWTARRRTIADRYLEAFVDLPLGLPHERPGEHGVWSTFTVRSPRRDDLRTHLADQGVETLIYYPIPIHRQPAARDLGYGAGALPVAERHADDILSLPIRPELDDDEVDQVISAVRAFFDRPGT